VTTRSHRTLAATAAALACLALGTGPALAAGSSPSPAPTSGAKSLTVPANNITFALATSNGRTNDGRQIFRYTAKPGEVIRDNVIVYNLGKVKGTFAVYGMDAVTTENGSFTLATITDKQKKFGAWTDVSKNFIVLPGGKSIVVPFTITVPKNANPGDVVGGVVVSDVPLRQSINSVQQALSVATRIGIRTVVRVEGTLHASVRVDHLASSFDPSHSRPGYGRYTLSWDVVNDGNVRVSADRAVDIAALLGGTVRHEDRSRLEQILPGDTIHESVSLDNVFAGVRLTGSVSATAVVLEGQVPPEASSVASETVWAISWLAVGLISVVVALLVLLLLRLRHRRSTSGPSQGPGGGGRHAGGGGPAAPTPERVPAGMSS
jgi:hypothetical protein